jgi:hypothetical protein
MFFFANMHVPSYIICCLKRYFFQKCDELANLEKIFMARFLSPTSFKVLTQLELEMKTAVTLKSVRKNSKPFECGASAGGVVYIHIYIVVSSASYVR